MFDPVHQTDVFEFYKIVPVHQLVFVQDMTVVISVVFLSSVLSACLYSDSKGFIVLDEVLDQLTMQYVICERIMAKKYDFAASVDKQSLMYLKFDKLNFILLLIF